MKSILDPVKDKECCHVAQQIEYNPNIPLTQIQRIWMDKAVAHFNGNITQAAKALGLSRSTLYRNLGEGADGK